MRILEKISLHPLLTLSFVLVLICFQASAQTDKTAFINGTVINEKGQPVFGVNIAIKNKAGGSSTDENGYFQIKIPALQKITLVFSAIGYKDIENTYQLLPGQVQEQGKILMQSKSTSLPTINIEDKQRTSDFITPINPKSFEALPNASGTFEAVLKTFSGVVSNNELSSAYSVRGGNFDENLVYVNDIEIYRPFLVRQGQQEGLSFINSDLVEQIEFSAGGFNATYGDKMSSVLDIKYKKPDKMKGGISASLLGGNIYFEGTNKNKKVGYLMGARYKSTNYLLGTLDTKGDYKPLSADFQSLITYTFNKKHSLSFLGNYAHTTYNIIPSTRETDFGTINQALRLTIFFDGQELDKFNTYVGAVSYDYTPNDSIRLKFIASAFTTFEDEAYTIQGQYFLDELERDLGSDAFGETAANLGVGTYIDHARNYLDAQVFNIEHKGYFNTERNKISWGVRFQREKFKSELWQWNYIDSSGFSVPLDPSDQILLNNVVITNDTLQGNRYMVYINNLAFPSWNENVRLNYGIRLSHYSVNKQTVVSPRISMYYDPPSLKNFTLKFSTGLYYQPPFFKEMISYNGQINADLRAQKSIHFIAGMDYTFLGWGREFKFVSEAYYKILDDLVPYKFDNLRIRYYANNDSKGYATGMDFRINGEFVQGVESWASLSFLSTKEDIANDDYYNYINSDGEIIVPGVSNNTVAVDSQYVVPGYISRPTDQRATFSLFFQDYLPSSPYFKMNMTLVYGTGLPFGPPGEERYKDIFKYPPYRRVDIGFLYQFIDSEYNRPARFKSMKWIKSMWISLEVFNLLQANNTVSYNWIKDISGRQYAVPNYLTGRQLNLRMQLRF